MKGKPIVILLVEDDPAHAEIVRRNFATSHMANQLIHVEDGQAALDYLYHKDKFHDPHIFPVPDLILLDLRLPKVDGLEVLKTIKLDENLRQIPVVVLTTSAAEADIVNAYEFSTNSYLVKPVDFPQFIKLMESLDYYWLAWNKYPYKPA